MFYPAHPSVDFILSLFNIWSEELPRSVLLVRVLHREFENSRYEIIYIGQPGKLKRTASFLVFTINNLNKNLCP